MALWICGDCGAAYSVGAECCPQCGSGEYREDHVPKIDSAGLATGAYPVPSGHEVATADPEPAALEQAAQGPEGGGPASEVTVPGAGEGGDTGADAAKLEPPVQPKPAKAPKAPPKPPAKAPDG